MHVFAFLDEFDVLNRKNPRKCKRDRPDSLPSSAKTYRNATSSYSVDAIIVTRTGHHGNGAAPIEGYIPVCEEEGTNSSEGWILRCIRCALKSFMGSKRMDQMYSIYF